MLDTCEKMTGGRGDKENGSWILEFGLEDSLRFVD